MWIMMVAVPCGLVGNGVATAYWRPCWYDCVVG